LEREVPVLILWCCFAAALLIVSLVVHVSTIAGIDPTEVFPGVMFVHIAVLLAFAATIYYVRRYAGKDQLKRVTDHAPGWLLNIAVVFFAYALVNFAICMFVLWGVSQATQRDGKYVVLARNAVVREITAAEYHWQQADVVRAFSGHWVMFSSLALTFLVGVANLRRRGTPAPDPSTPRTDQGIVPESAVLGVMPAERGIEHRPEL
jgi:hypothetical protein